MDMPLRPEKIWQAVRASLAGELDQSDPTLPDFLADKAAGQGENSKTYVFE